ncbi:MAG: hypothetical protein ABSD90_09540 [Methylocystis sp.]|jgi:hypothetical protein
MSFTVDASDHLILKRREPFRTRLARFVVAYAASLAINIALLLLMFIEIEVLVEVTPVEETPVEVVVEAPALDAPDIMQESPPPPVAEQQPAARASTANVADEERQLKAPPGQETIAGDGTGDNPNGSTPRREATRDRESEEIDPDPRKEISRLIAPAAPKPVPRDQPRTAPPRPSRKPIAKEKPRVATTETEPTVKKQEIHCGANATRPVYSLPPPARQATVLGHATAAQAAQMIQNTQAQMDMPISGRYVANARVFVHIDGTPDRAWQAALLPAGLSAQTGDRVQFTPTHLDPASPCHYIPALISRVL